MLPQLPQEIIDRIAFYLPHEKAVGLSKYTKEKLGDKVDVDEYAEKGNLFAIKWMHYHEQGKWQTETMDCAARGGHLAVVKWLHRYRSEGCTFQAMNAAAARGDLEMVQWLHDNRTEGCTFRAMIEAARNGHLEIVLWLFANRKDKSAEYNNIWAGFWGRIALIQCLSEEIRENSMAPR